MRELEGFDWTAQPSVDQRQIRELATCRWIAHGDALLLLGPPGTRKLAIYARPKLLIIDELGYLPFEPDAAHLFFQLVSRRYGRGSMLVTSNRSFVEWGTVFGDPVVATAILDRLLHHCSVCMSPSTMPAGSLTLNCCQAWDVKWPPASSIEPWPGLVFGTSVEMGIDRPRFRLSLQDIRCRSPGPASVMFGPAPRIAAPGNAFVVAGWGDPQNPADRLDPIGIQVLVTYGFGCTH